MHIRVNMVGSFTGVQIGEDTTVQDVIDTLLDRNDVPLEYGELCTILEIRQDNFGYPLAKTELVKRFENSGNTLHFRVLCIPTKLDSSKMEGNFVELLHNQIHRLIITKTWIVDDTTAMKVAAFRCGVEFGKFDAKKHKDGFLDKTISQFVSADLISHFKQRELEKNILTNWKEISEQGMCEPHDKAVANYISMCQTGIKQYGCATFVAKLLSMCGQEADQFVYLGINQDGILFLSPDGNEIAMIAHSELTAQIPQDAGDTRVTLVQKKDGAENQYIIEINGSKALELVIQFMQNVKMPVE